MSAASSSPIPYEEYVRGELTGDVRHEYLRGHVWAMAGGSPEHARLAMAMGRELALALGRKPCVVLSSDARVRIEATDRTTYPDVTVVCGAREVSAKDAHAVVNPTLIVEVLSETTEANDRGERFAHYRHLASLQEYVLVSQGERHVEVYRRTPEGWLFTEASAGERLALRSIDVELEVDAVYFDPTV